jgi:hypothetical protein
VRLAVLVGAVARRQVQAHCILCLRPKMKSSDVELSLNSSELRRDRIQQAKSRAE